MNKLCKRGHPLSGDNLYVSPRGARMCKACADLRRSGKAEPVSTIGRTCPKGHCVDGDNLIQIGGRNACVACRKENHDSNRKKLKEEVIEAYGGECSCCGESIPAFLTVDHVNNDGAEHRKLVRAGSTFHRWLRDNGFPKDNFRLLCWNCNSGRQFNGGICPHSELS